MFQLSKKGEQKLLRTLYETLKSQAALATIAYARGNYDELHQIGHSLRGNSGAAYFHLSQVGEIGKQFHQISELEPSTFTALLSELNEIVMQLQREIDSLN